MVKRFKGVIVGSLSYMKCLEATVVVIGRYINKVKLNSSGTPDVDSAALTLKSSVTNLGVKIDSALSFDGSDEILILSPQTFVEGRAFSLQAFVTCQVSLSRPQLVLTGKRTSEHLLTLASNSI